MASVLTVVAKLEANATNFIAGMNNAARAAEVLSAKTQDAGKNMKSNLGGSMDELKTKGDGLGGMFKGLLGVFAGYQTVNFLKSSVQQANSFEAEFEGVNQAFGKGATMVQEFAKTAALTAGVTEVGALKAAKSFGVYGKTAGLAGAEQAKFANTLVQTAGDLGSFFDLPTEQALFAIQAGLRGESEPLRRFNIMIDQNTIKQKAMEMGLYSGKGALDQHARVLAANAVILGQVGVAQGDFVKYQDQYGNAIKIVGAQWQNLQKDIGGALLPALAKLMQAIMPVIQSLGPLLKSAMESLVPAIVAVTGAFQYIVPILQPVIAVLGLVLAAFSQGVSGAIPAFAEVIIGLMPIVQSIGTLFAQLIPIVMNAAISLANGLGPTILEVGGWLQDTLLPIISNLVSWLGTVLPGTINFLIDTFNKFKGVILGMVIAWGVIRGAMLLYTVISAVVNAWNKFMVASTVAQSIATWAAVAAQWALNLAMNANPIGLIVTAIVLLVAGLVALGAWIYYLATQTTFFQDVWAALVKKWNETIAFISGIFKKFFDGISNIWNGIIDLFTGKGGDKLAQGMGQIWSGIVDLVRGYVNTLIDAVNAMFGWTGLKIPKWMSEEEKQKAAREAREAAATAAHAYVDETDRILSAKERSGYGYKKSNITVRQADGGDTGLQAMVTPPAGDSGGADKAAERAKSLKTLGDSMTKIFNGLKPVSAAIKKMGQEEKAVYDASVKATEELTKANDAGTISAKKFATLKAKYKKQFGELQALAKQRDELASRIEKRKAIFDSMYKDLVGGADITKMGNSTQSILVNLNRYYDGLKTYQENLAKLRTAGISDKLYEQIVSSGFESGSATAKALLSDTSQLASIDALTQNIDSMSQTIASTSASSLYTSGQSAIGGFIDGLLSDQKALESAATSIAGTLTKQVKKDLGIHSPSRVLRALGQNVTEGFNLGMNDVPSVLNTGVGDISLNGATSAANTGGGATYQITINAGMGADGATIGRELVQTLKNYERQNGAVWAKA